MQVRLPDLRRASKAPLTPDQQAESARILCALVRREITLAEALQLLPGQLPTESS